MSSTRRHIIVCEGESERAYLQRLQSFLEGQPVKEGAFESPVKFIAPKRTVAKSGSFGPLKRQYNEARKNNKSASIKIWADFDLYHRNEMGCADLYVNKANGIPDFHFSFHNFEDFLALHLEEPLLQQWLRFGKCDHFISPLHSCDYLPEFQRIYAGYKKGSLPVDFITWVSLRNLKRNKMHQPISYCKNAQNLLSFAEFLVTEIEASYPSELQ